MARVFIIEDDPEIRRLVANGLARSGHDVETAASALDGLKQVIGKRFEVLVLDLGLPDMGGDELLRMLRAVSEIPVIVATARDDDASAIALLDSGADDYIVKPFAVEHLEARIRAVMRRGHAAGTSPELRVGGLWIDPASREASVDGTGLDLTPKEFDLLLFLAERSGEVVTKRELLAQVWREPYGGSERTVDVHLSWLRRKLGESAAEPRYLRTVHGVGVKLVEP